mgnify:CR=1 FL=1
MRNEQHSSKKGNASFWASNIYRSHFVVVVVVENIKEKICMLTIFFIFCRRRLKNYISVLRQWQRRRCFREFWTRKNPQLHGLQAINFKFCVIGLYFLFIGVTYKVINQELRVLTATFEFDPTHNWRWCHKTF